MWRLLGIVGAACGIVLVGGMSVKAADSIWDIEAVDADGVGTDPRVGGDPTDPNSWVVVEGIALNASAELLGASMWQVYVQGEAPDAGGIAAWQGVWFNPPGWPWPPFPDVQAGDGIRIEGLISDHNGKVNINSRHSSDPGMQFTVTILDANVGMPPARIIPNIAACTSFDQTRATGGEQYQAQWCQLNDVWTVGGSWVPGETVSVTDASGQELSLFLSDQGGFANYPAPVGTFCVRGVFDQEDAAPPAHEGYRLWVKRYADLRYRLSIDVVNDQAGHVEIAPEPDDANLMMYPGGTEVTLVAVPDPGRGFRHWKVYDANHPDDANYLALDSNTTIAIMMDANRRVTAVFLCGGGVGTYLPLMASVLALWLITRRRR